MLSLLSLFYYLFTSTTAYIYFIFYFFLSIYLISYSVLIYTYTLTFLHYVQYQIYHVISYLIKSVYYITIKFQFIFF